MLPTRVLSESAVFLETKQAYPLIKKRKAAPLANDKSDNGISALNTDASATMTRAKKCFSQKHSSYLSAKTRWEKFLFA